MKCSPEELKIGHGVNKVDVLQCHFPSHVERAVLERETRAFELGRLAGQRDLSEQLLQQRQELLIIRDGVLRSLQGVVPDLARACESMLVELAVEVANKLVCSQEITASMLEAIVHETLAQTEESTEFTILLNPADLQMLEDAQSPLLSTPLNHQKMTFHSSADISRGGCIVQTRFGSVDGRRETKLEIVKKALLE